MFHYVRPTDLLMGKPTSQDEFCRAMFDQAPTPVLVEVDGQIRYINAAGLALVGAANRSEVVGLAMAKFLDTRRRALQPLGGPTLEVETTSWPVGLNGYAATATLLLPRPSLRDSEAQFRRLFEEAPIAYHEMTRTEDRTVNRAECELLGFSREELLGKDAWDVVAPEQRELSRQRVGEKLTGTRAARALRAAVHAAGRRDAASRGPRETDSGESRRDGRHPNGDARHHGRRSGPNRSCSERTRNSTRAADGARGGGVEEPVSGQHEPRDPHADERRDRHDRAAAGYAT